MVNPDQIRAIERDRVATPDELRVEVGDSNVLDDDVASSGAETKSLSLDTSTASNTEKSLVRSNIDRRRRSFVPSRLKGRGVAAIVADDLLASLTRSPVRTHRAGFRSLGVGKVEDVLEDDDARLFVREVSLQLLDVLGTDCLGVATTRDTGGETFSLACDGLRGDDAGETG